MNIATTASLAVRLKAETRQLHTLAERSGVMVDLLQGRLGLGGYCELLRHLHAIYAALEAALDRHPPPARLWRQELRRLASLEQDLDRLHAAPWRADPSLKPAAAAYVTRLQALERADPTRLVAHAYVRYLGDLHGGQMLARMIRQRFDLEGPQGTAFYAFGEPERVETLKQDFRAGLDALDLTHEQADALVAEACEAFRLHVQLFEELRA